MASAEQALELFAELVEKHMQVLDKYAQGYSHRNGETEPPTVEGWYWWIGTVVGSYTEKGLVSVTVPRDNSKIQIWPSWCDGWLGIEDMLGEWWGPLVPPWGDNA